MSYRASRRAAMAIAGAIVLCTASAAHLAGQAPAPQLSAKRFESGIVVSGDWLQANALPLDRNAMQSASFDLSLRRQSWFVDAGFLRVARDLSTVQGGSLSAGPLLHFKQVLFLPKVSAMVGQSFASRDTTGYNWVGTGGTSGHVARFSYSDAAAYGFGGGLTIEVPIYRMIGVRVDASQWWFGGTPLEGDRTRTLIGAGLSLRVWR